MPAWLPVLKAALPYIGPVLQSAIPAFTKRKSEQADPVVSQQISELQEAVKNNTESLKAVAKAMEESARANDVAMKRMRSIAIGAGVAAAVSLVVAIAALVA